MRRALVSWSWSDAVITSAVSLKIISPQLLLKQLRLILPLQEQTLESQLCDARVALEQALSDRERLLLEIQKYDPTYTL